MLVHLVVSGLQHLSLSGDGPLVNVMVDNVHLEHGVVYEYVSSAGIKHHVLEKMVEPKGCFSLTAKVISHKNSLWWEYFEVECLWNSSVLWKNIKFFLHYLSCFRYWKPFLKTTTILWRAAVSWSLRASVSYRCHSMSSEISATPNWRVYANVSADTNRCVTTHIISLFFLSDVIKSLHPNHLFHLSHSQFADELQNKGSPMLKQASSKPHILGCMDFVPTNCHLNLMQVSCPKSTTSAGRAFSIRFGRKNSFFGLDPDQGWCSFKKLSLVFVTCLKMVPT